MKQLWIGARVLLPNGSFANYCPVLTDDDRIIAVLGECAGYTPDRIINLEGKTLIPGLVDVHTHGRIGYDFSDATKEQMLEMKADYARRGVTSVFATLASASGEEWHRAIAAAQECGFDGIHLEGRYLNPAKRGAHAPELLVRPDAADLEEFLREIKVPCHISAAYELDADGSFAKKALEYGATLGLAHTMATADEARTAIERGVTSFTHLYNAMPPLHHRDGGAVSVALSGGYYGELIVDGMHVCPDMVRLAYHCLGKEKLVLITDSMQGTGCPDGNYSIAGMPVTVKNGKAITSDGALAGSTLNLFDAVKNLVKFAGVPFGDAVLCATRNPAKMVGIDGEVGSIASGRRADFLILDKELNLQTVVMRGEILDGGKNA